MFLAFHNQEMLKEKFHGGPLNPLETGEFLNVLV